MTQFAANHLLASDKARFEMGREVRKFTEVQEAKSFFESQRANWKAFGDGMDRAKPQVIDASGGTFSVEFTHVREASEFSQGLRARML